MLDHRKVVGDEKIDDPEMLLNSSKQIHDLRPDRDVQRGRGFVQNNEARVQRERSGHGDALTLTPAEFMGV